MNSDLGWIDSNHIILDRIRLTIHVLRKSDFCRNPQTEEGAIPTALKELQAKIRCSEFDNIDLSSIIHPFLQILKSSNLAGPYKLSALETLQTFIKQKLFHNSEEVAVNIAVKEIVQSVICCKFIQTDIVGDELVQLQLLKTLQSIIYSIDDYVKQEATSDILQFFFNILETVGGNKNATLRYQIAEDTVIYAMKKILQLLALTATSSPGSEKISTTARNNLTSTFVHALKYVAKILKKYSYDIRNQAKNEAASAANTPAASSGASSKDPAQKNVNKVILTDSEISYIIYLLNLLQMIWIEAKHNIALIGLLTTEEQISSVIHGNIGFAVIHFGAQFELLPMKIFQTTLDLFTTIVTVTGGSMRYVVEHFFRQVHLKALAQYVDFLHYQVGNTHPIQEIFQTKSSYQKLSAVADANGVMVFPQLRIEAIEMILDSLCDLIAEDSFLPSLYASFDCYPTAIDIVKPFVQLLTKASSIVLTTGTEKLSIGKELGIIVVQCYKQLLHSFSRRKSLQALRTSNTSHPNSLSSHSQAVGEDHPHASSSHIHSAISTMFASARTTKDILQHAADKFHEKPAKCFQYLQAVNIFAKPLSPMAVANFLRMNTYLAKEDVGSFLGELGKQKESEIKYDSDTVQFHQELLTYYVQSFSLHQNTILNCVRIFLSAFRLPGEAQQIDRILVAFSEYCYEHSQEKTSQIIENPEVTYLLTFSIIMLNTDRHNPNIKQERKMTLEQFIRNNTFYGADVKQTKPIPRDYLESIYSSISEQPIRTETSSDPLALVTVEEWTDISMTIQKYRESMLLFSTRYPTAELLPYILNNASTVVEEESSEAKGDDEIPKKKVASSAALVTDEEHLQSLLALSSREQILAALFAQPIHNSGFLSCFSLAFLCDHLNTVDWIWDLDLLQTYGSYLLLPGMSVTYYNHIILEDILASEDTVTASLQQQSSSKSVSRSGILTSHPSTASMTSTTSAASTATASTNVTVASSNTFAKAGTSRYWKERTGRLLDLSIDFLWEYLQLLSSYDLSTMMNFIMMLFLQMSGLYETNVVQEYYRMVCITETVPQFVNNATTLPLPSLFTSRSTATSPKYHYPDHCHFIWRISYFTVQRSLSLFLTMLSTYYHNITNWSLVLYPLSILRDMNLLPSDMIFLDAADAATPMTPATPANHVHDNSTIPVASGNTNTQSVAQTPLHHPNHHNNSMYNTFQDQLPHNIQQEFDQLLSKLEQLTVQKRQEEARQAVIKKQQEEAALAAAANQQSSAASNESIASFFTLRSLGEALFGSSGNNNGSMDLEEDDENEKLSKIIHDRYHVRPSRWDTGYGNIHSIMSIPIDALAHERYLQLQQPSSASNSSGGSGSGNVGSGGSSHHGAMKSFKWDVNHLRSMIAKTNIVVLINESKFLHEEHLLTLMKSIIKITEGYNNTHVTNATSHTHNQSGNTHASTELVDFVHEHHALSTNTTNLSSNLHHSFAGVQTTQPHDQVSSYALLFDTKALITPAHVHTYTTSSSYAWLEMVLVEIALRNRDRFHLCWPLLRSHYQRCLSQHSFTKLSYVTERQLHGLLKLTARMLSRDNYAGILLELLGRIFHPITRQSAAIFHASSGGGTNSTPIKLAAPSGSASMDLEDDMLITTTTAVSSATHSAMATYDNISGLSNQISLGIWKILTQNVDLLPLLSLEQWEIIFKIISFGATSGSFAAFKSFEVMAWLLHEPRLISSVPVFCIIAIKPLIINHQAPAFVSTGAVRLLKYLHTRLEALLPEIPSGNVTTSSPHATEASSPHSPTKSGKSASSKSPKPSYPPDSEDDGPQDTAESSTVWKKCWVPILQSMAEGIVDDREEVRQACGSTLCEAIQDRHSDHVPIGVLIDLLAHILTPVIRILGDYLIADWHKHCLNQLNPPSTPSPSTAAGNKGAITSTGVTGSTYTSGSAARAYAKTAGIDSYVPTPPSTAGTEGDWVKIDTSSSPAPPPEGDHPAPTLPSLPITSSQPGNPSPMPNHIVFQCLQTLLTVFRKHARRLSHYPTFDKLWLQIIHLLSYFIARIKNEESSPYYTSDLPRIISSTSATNATPIAHPPVSSPTTTQTNGHPDTKNALTRTQSTSSSQPSPQQPQQHPLNAELLYLLQSLATISYEQLEGLLLFASREGVFVRRDGLWAVTKEYLAQMMNAESLVRLIEGDAAVPVVPPAITLSLYPTPSNSAKNSSADLVNNSVTPK